MEFKDEKIRFQSVLIEEGFGSIEAQGIQLAVPKELQARWIKKHFAKQPEMTEPKEPRLANRFMVGADPEFFFFRNGAYFYAENLGLTTLTAFGCDLAGRQGELRIAPSRYVLDLMGSITETLRWMSERVPETRNLQWLGIPFVQGGPNGRDGAGGHIHLARKSVKVEPQMDSLDAATLLCLRSGVLNYELFVLRNEHTVYGKWKDRRPQPYGFEYRTPPTWMSSPQVAYLVIVIHKLCSHHRLAIKPKPTKARCQAQVLNLLRAYRGLDDDAALALRMIETGGWPEDVATDFKERWGVETIFPKAAQADVFIPAVINGSPSTRSQVFQLFNGATKTLTKASGVCTWEPYILPEKVYQAAITPHVKDIPDYAMGVVSYKHGVTYTYNSGVNGIRITCPFTISKKDILKAFKDVCPVTFHSGEAFIIHMPQGPRDVGIAAEQRKKMRDALANPELLPLCKVKDLNGVDWSRWDVELPKPTIIKRGKKIAEVQNRPRPDAVGGQDPLMGLEDPVGWREVAPAVPARANGGYIADMLELEQRMLGRAGPLPAPRGLNQAQQAVPPDEGQQVVREQIRFRPRGHRFNPID